MNLIPGHCPGFEQNKILKTFACKCPDCGAEAEIFSDEFDRIHKCKKCKGKIDPKSCVISGSGGV